MILMTLTELIEIQVERNIALKEMEDIVGFDISFSDERMVKDIIELAEKKGARDLLKILRGF